MRQEWEGGGRRRKGSPTAYGLASFLGVPVCEDTQPLPWQHRRGSKWPTAQRPSVVLQPLPLTKEEPSGVSPSVLAETPPGRAAVAESSGVLPLQLLDQAHSPF